MQINDNEKEYEGLTERQKQAVKHDDGNALVSASAGAGKTTVVIKRILRLIEKENGSLKNIIAVTFTKAAAEKMKDDLREKLTEKYVKTGKEKYKEQLALVQDAEISTIHSFCSKLLRRYFYLTELDCKFEVAEEMRAEVLMKTAMEQTFDELYAEENPDFLDLVMAFGKNRKDGDLRNFVYKLHEFCVQEGGVDKVLEKTLKNHENPDESLKELVLLPLLHSVENARDKFSELAVEFQDDEMRKNYCEKLVEIIDKALLKAQENDNVLDVNELLSQYGEVNAPRNPVKYPTVNAKLGAVKSAFKETLENAVTAVTSQGDEKAVELSKNRSVNLLKLTETFINRYSALKREENLVDFADLETFTLKLLQNQEVLQEIHKTYQHVFIDEYQDVNNVQEQILTAVSNNNLFMVGDSKQSIYAFRGCNPKFFVEKSARYELGEGTAIPLDNNFRSASSIIETVNNIFSEVMTEDFGGTNYAKNPMIYGDGYATYPGKTQLHLVKKAKRETAKVAEERGVYSVKNTKERFKVLKRSPEAELVVKLVADSLGTEYYNSKDKKMVPVEPKDVCILLRSMTNKLATDIITGLTESGIYATSSIKTEIKDYPEIQLLLNLLSVLVCAERDVPLATVMKTLFKFGDNDLAEIRYRAKNSKIPFYECVNVVKNDTDALGRYVKEFVDWLDEKRLIAEFSGVGEVMYGIIKETNYYAEVMASTGGDLKIKRIERFLAESVSGTKALRAQEFETHIAESLSELNVSEAVGDNCVKVMTMHASKGLDFPVVIVPGASNAFNMKDLSKPVIWSKEYGVAVQSFNLEDMTVCENKARKVIQESIKRNSIVEELRLFYVALTRAKYKLYVTATSDDYDGVIPNDKYTIKNNLGFIPFNAMEIVYHDDDKVEKSPEDGGDDKDAGNQIDEDLVGIIKDGVSYVYPYEEEVKLPVKRTVSEIRNAFDDEVYKTTSLYGESSAEKGTAYHRILELADFYAYAGASDNARFLELGLLTQEQFNEIDAGKVKSILSLSIFNKIKDYTLYKERQFCALIPANEISDSSSSEEVLVQGVIDLLAVKDNKAILIDYKLSTIESDADLKKKYLTQMQLYKSAIERILKLNVEEIVIVNVLKESEIYV